MIGPLLRPDLQELIREKRWDVLRDALSAFDPSDTAEILLEVPDEDDVAIFRLLPRDVAGQVFSYLPLDHQENLLRSLTQDQMRTVLQGMTPDDQARLLEELPAAVTRRLLERLLPDQLRAARDLLGYAPGTAGRYMTPQYVTLRPEMTAREALEHVRRVGRGKETLNILYVVDGDGKLIEELRLGSLVLADPDAKIAEIEKRPLVAITATTKREEALRTFKKYDRAALPVTDKDGYMLGIITADDVLDVAEREATEDIQKIGGMEALDAPYLDVGYFQMLWKRGGWLSALFLGEMLTATAMGYFEDEIAKAVVLAMFVPLISSAVDCDPAGPRGCRFLVLAATRRPRVGLAGGESQR
jgi:magnesium transporter